MTLLFALIAAALLLLALALPAAALLRRPRAAEARDASESNLAVLRAQLAQLDRELAGGALDPSQHALSRAEIQRRVLDEEAVASAPARDGAPRTTLVLLLLAVPGLALALYAALGNPGALSPAATVAQAEPTQQDVEVLVAKLAERMEQQPPGRVEDVQGWAMLGRTYAALQRYPEAVRAFTRALQLTPHDAQLLADQADALAMQQGQTLQGEPTRLIEQALRIDPANLKALALAGSAAYERKDFAVAAGYWTRARSLAPADSELARGLERSIAEAQAMAGSPAAPLVAAGPPGADAAPASAPAATSITGRVSLAPALAARVAPGDTVFVFARAAEGPRMPLAIARHSASELPLRFTLDDSMAMSPQLKLSSFPRVVVGARISKSGNATPQSGDLQGQAGPLPNHSAAVDLVIDAVTP